jgi:prepilin-type processing-associated H-X9-DG protein
VPLNTKTAPEGESWNPNRWYYTAGFRSQHKGGANFAIADGSVAFIQDSISLSVYRAAATLMGGETVYWDS